LLEEKGRLQGKVSWLVSQQEEVGKENRKWKEQHDQLKERMSSLRVLNKQLENKANQNWVMLRRNDFFKENEDRMIKAESRVAELETSLAQFIEDFEKQNADLTVCAQKLTLSENRVQFLTKRSQELERETKSLTEKLCNIKKPPPKTLKVNLC